MNFNPEDPVLAEAGRASVLALERNAAETTPKPSATRNVVDGLVGGFKRVMGGTQRHSPDEQSTYSPASSETLHETLETGFDAEATTAVDHGQDAILVEPQPGSDYAKMDTPTPPASDTSLNSYIARIHKFIRDINALPWIGSDRVTIDYIPGESKRRARPRPILSWYNEHGGRRVSVDLLSSGSSSSPVPQMRPASFDHSHVQPIYPNGGYAAIQPSPSVFPKAIVFTQPNPQTSFDLPV